MKSWRSFATKKKRFRATKANSPNQLGGGNTICHNLTNMTIIEVEKKNEISFKRHFKRPMNSINGINSTDTKREDENKNK